MMILELELLIQMLKVKLHMFYFTEEKIHKNVF